MPALLLPLLMNIAPTVASWLMGDKTGQAVEKITGIAQEVLGTTDANGIERAIASDPNLAMQFRTMLIQAEADARRLQFEELREELQDRQSARNQTVELAKAGSPIAWGAVVISTIVMAGFSVMLWLVIKQEVPASQRELVMYMLSALQTMATGVVGYWVGSSSGSAQKTAALESIVKTKA